MTRSEILEAYLVLSTQLHEHGCHLEFDCNGDRRGRYAIYQSRCPKSGNPAHYEKIALWNAHVEGNELEVLPQQDNRPIAVRRQGPPCRPEVKAGQIEQLYPNSQCCYWVKDLDLLTREYRVGFADKDNCDRGSWPNRNFSSCEKPEEETLRTSDSWSIFSILLAVFGLLLAIGFFAFSAAHFEHRVIKNSSRELSTIAWVGILIAQINTFLVFSTTPSAGICGLMRFTSTLGYTFILSSLFLKTNRLFRIFYSQFSGDAGFHKAKFTSPRHQVLICLGLISVQVLIVIVWIAADPPKEMIVYPLDRATEEDHDGRAVLQCRVSPFHLLLVQSYNIVLCVVTTAYSILTRKLPEGFNESRFINLSMYSVCVAWLLETIAWAFREDLTTVTGEQQYYPEVSIFYGINVT